MTDIQCKSLPLSLSKKDVMGAAKTGSVQIFEVLCKIGKKHSFSAGLIIGGKDVTEERERISKMNILICTPGRLLQHMDQAPEFDLSNLQILVLDEADRLLDMGFKNTINAIIENIPKKRQTLLFSATQTKSVKDLARLSLKDPEYVAVHESSSHATPQKLSQYYLETELFKKLDVLYSFIKTHLKSRILVFMSSNKQVRFIYETFCKLQPGVPLLHLYGKQKQMARVQVYERFMRMPFACMFCTDIAARGLDFPAVDWVVQLDCPEDVDTYIHRVGRSARYDSVGNALLFLLPSELEFAELLEKRKIPISKINTKQNKTLSISNQLQHFCFQDPEIKYLGQKSFISYVRSVYLQKLKNVFDVHSLPINEYAESLGLPGAPKIKFLKLSQKGNEKKSNPFALNEDAQNSKDVLPQPSNDGNGNSEAEDESDSIQKKPSEVVTKFSKMVNRKNIGVLADHYSKIVDRNENGFNGADSSDDDDFLIPKKSINPSEDPDDIDNMSKELVEQKSSSYVKVLAVNPVTNMPVVMANIPENEMTKRQLKKAKEKVLKNMKNQRHLFDEEGNIKPIVEMMDEDTFYKAGSVNSQVLNHAQESLTKMKDIDLEDKMLAKEKRRLKRALKKQKEKDSKSKSQGAVLDLPSTQIQSDNENGYNDEYSSSGEEIFNNEAESDDSSYENSKYSEDENPGYYSSSDQNSDNDKQPRRSKKHKSNGSNNSKLDLQDQEKLALELLGLD
ncbi:ATP-dependent RNA helicase dbp-4 [Smittium mucronatum]|uniref:ATP-dependent RNA helicase n=1 Tax=Smittium mucronatum TaxID=133383 RepID=A0A1R0H7P7_9FUNG|nr:ATP-dependent RNA helicase dbp-4 [Smittium mucronatum]